MWSETVGLVNGQHKYLTAETFGFKINANGVALKKKQLWSIEPFPIDIAFDEVSELEHVAIKSHLGCYLAVDSFGNVTCDSQDVTKGACFTITICAMSGVGDGKCPAPVIACRLMASSSSCVVCLPFVTLVVMTSMENLDYRYEVVHSCVPVWL